MLKIIILSFFSSMSLSEAPKESKLENINFTQFFAPKDRKILDKSYRTLVLVHKVEKKIKKEL